MSASTEKKQRQAAREAGTDKKLLAQQEEDKKRAKNRRNWIIGGIAIILVIAFTILLNTGFLYKSTTALTVGDSKYSPAEVNYYYGSQYLNFANQYGSYASMFGLDVSGGIAGLRNQACPMMEDGTWRDYFLDLAEHDIVQMKALTDYAAANGITLDEDELASVNASFEGVDDYAKAQGFRNADALFAYNYGEGVDKKIVLDSSAAGALANKAYNTKADSLEYTDEELEAFYQDSEGAYDVYDYAYYYVTAAVAEGAEAPDEVALTEAQADADAIVNAYKDGDDIEDLYERFEVAVESQTEQQPTHRSNATASGLSAVYSEWLTDSSRKAGDVSVQSDENGYYVVLFLDHSDNHYATVSVRHILIRAEASEDGSYSDAAKDAALARAEEILAEYQAGEQTEESFAALAEQYSEDEGSNTNGGLYEDIYKGEMVEEFDAFCFEGHQPGDVAIVYGESGSYAGYHVVYFVGEGELYSNVIARGQKQSEDMSAWLEELESAYEPIHGGAYRYVG